MLWSSNFIFSKLKLCFKSFLEMCANVRQWKMECFDPIKISVSQQINFPRRKIIIKNSYYVRLHSKKIKKRWCFVLLHNNDLHLTNNDLTLYSHYCWGKRWWWKTITGNFILYWKEKENKLFPEKCSDFIPNAMVAEKRIENTLKFQDENFSTYVGCRFHK